MKSDFISVSKEPSGIYIFEPIISIQNCYDSKSFTPLTMCNLKTPDILFKKILMKQRIHSGMLRENVL